LASRIGEIVNNVLDERREKEVADEIERQRAAAAKAAEHEYEEQHKGAVAEGDTRAGVKKAEEGENGGDPDSDLNLGEIPELPKPAPGGTPASAKPPGRSDYKSFGSVTKRQFPSVMALQNKTQTMFLVRLLVHKLRVEGEGLGEVEEAMGNFNR
jgi:hypothetical protein